MTIGDPKIFAIESEIFEAYENLGFFGLGFFVLHVNSHQYGVREENATMLGCALSEAQERLYDRGKHIAPFAYGNSAKNIIQGLREARYDPFPKRELIWGLSLDEINNIVGSSKCYWDTRCDEAFDDGSLILQFDIKEKVRLIANKTSNSLSKMPEEHEFLQDLIIDSPMFYGILEEWIYRIKKQWNDMTKKEP